MLLVYYLQHHLCLEYENEEVQFFTLSSLRRTVKYSDVDVSCYFEWIRIISFKNDKVQYIDCNLSHSEWIDWPVIEKVIDGRLFTTRIMPVDFNHVT